MSQTPDASEQPAAPRRDVPQRSAEANGPSAPLVLDASFVIGVLQGEPAATRLLGCLPGSTLLTPNLGEVFYKLHEATRVPPEQIEPVLNAYGVRVVDLPVGAVRHFPALRGIDKVARAAARAAGVPAGSLSLADVSVLGYALHTGMEVLTGDRHWTTLGAHGLTVPVHLY